MTQPGPVIVTGATGNLGGKAVERLAGLPGIELLRLAHDDGGRGVVAADLAIYDRRWARLFEGAACVLHLAADPKPVGTWPSIVRLNIDLGLNVLRAAEEGRVGRFVFASSNWIFGGYRFRSDRLSSSLPPRPVNPYGASKLFIERCGAAMADRTGMPFLSLRIGYCQPGENRPGPHMAFGRWGQEMWLGNDDWRQAVERAVTAPLTGFAAVNIVSRNKGMRWDLDEARAVIGYDPKQGHEPRRTIATFVKDQAARLRDALVPRTGERPIFGARW